jgi:hypothetical protein
MIITIVSHGRANYDDATLHVHSSLGDSIGSTTPEDLHAWQGTKWTASSQT